jgi:hypothetical protein
MSASCSASKCPASRATADWYRLLDLCGLTDTLISDADGVYHPAMVNDRLLLGLKGNSYEYGSARIESMPQTRSLTTFWETP